MRPECARVLRALGHEVAPGRKQALIEKSYLQGTRPRCKRTSQIVEQIACRKVIPLSEPMV